MRNIFIHILLLSIPFQLIAREAINDTIIHDGLERTFILYVPDTYTPGTAAPLVFNFHGYTSSAYEQMLYGDFRPIADSAGFIIVHPMGTKDASGNTHWNVGWGGSTVDDVGFTNALIDSISASYNIDSTRIYCTGMSNGGFMSYKLACESSDRFAAMASVTGSMNKGQPDICFPQHPVPVMEIHGTADFIVPYNGADWIESVEDVLAFWSDFNNCNGDPEITMMPDLDPNDGSTVEHHVYSDGDNGVKVEHFKVINGGHTWPGSQYGGFGTNYDIDASVEIWKFFSRYDINGKILPANIDQYEEYLSGIRIYPNPASFYIHIVSNSKEPLIYQLSALTGQKIKSGVIKAQNQVIGISELEKGLYLLTIGSRVFKIVVGGF